MARQRDPRRDQAREIWLKSDGEKLLKEIAKELGVSDSQIRKWKSQDKWAAELKGNVTNDKSNVTNRGGAPPGNRNAEGNRGNSRASPPTGNKNALKTGEYETIFEDLLSDEEKDIYSSLSDEPIYVLSEEIKLLKIRQRRMMQRIKYAEAGLDQEEIERLQQLRKVKEPTVIDGKVVTIKREALKDVQITRKQYRKIDNILVIEEALTRISGQLTKAVKQLADIGMVDKRGELMDAQIAKIKASTPEGGDDDGEPIIIQDPWSDRL